MCIVAVEGEVQELVSVRKLSSCGLECSSSVVFGIQLVASTSIYSRTASLAALPGYTLLLIYDDGPGGKHAACSTATKHTRACKVDRIHRRHSGHILSLHERGWRAGGEGR